MSDRPAPPAINPIRNIFLINSVPRRWPFALRAGICMAVPVLVGWLAGDTTAGLIATIGGFTSLYGSGRPYLNRGIYLGAVAVCFAAAVALGDWASATPWLGVATVTAIAVVATLVCHALSIGPPGAYMVVLACAAGTGTPATLHLSPAHHAALVLAGGAFAWLVHMSGALIRPRGPEKAAVAAAAGAVAAYLENPTPDTRHKAALLLHTAWVTLVNYQPVQPKPDQALYRLRVVNRRLHVLFAEAMRAADTGEPLAYDGVALARHLATLPADAVTDEHGAEGIPLGRPSALRLLRRALTPGSVSLQLAARVGVAVAISGVIAVLISQALTMTHAYWAMAAAVLMLHQGFDWQRTVARGAERTLGTWLGLGVAGAILALHPQGLWLALVIGALQFAIEMYVVRNYTLAVVFITPAALTIASGGQPIDNLGELLLTRGSDTLIGCAVALAVYWATQRLRHPTGLHTAITATLDAVTATLPHLAADDATSAAARTARRDLQLRAMELLPAYDASIGGSAAQRVGAERTWPTVVATEQLAYRTLAACWGAERDRDTDAGAEAAADTAAALSEQVCALREGLDQRQ
ncbi:MULTISPECIES: FUSC family protein [Mycolicibacterium]|uniref:Integral membrane protein n=1 Tax=Mycolicibacterium senegalense TaxID=1796 RepID=A0A378SWD2_9MYCO|nr:MULTISPECIES: FUSC family protein [Mycolicibacterium]MCV7334108.1 FUSC family protein [Mycolicibacterium senegalense]MDR7292160.1 putative membrane protein YccC [Mycolicibacterium senegalense]QZA23561.1 FUSC family protein [Mycolicibacterium senegalense]CDP88622.1 Inner membrane protein YccS [Mycolicibacterium farcinogenes]STZ52815.1 integral membrane protein [Mycolicibacterium senegalense]